MNPLDTSDANQSAWSATAHLIPPYAAETLSSDVPASVESRAVRFFRIEVFNNI
jgi:hypothetical protein